MNLSRCVKLNDRTIYNYENKNLLPKSVNSCINVIHQVRFDDDRKKAAVAHVLASLLHEPSYKTLRTTEQLGYTVKLAKNEVLKVIHISIMVQSNKFNCDYLEHRINEFLIAHAAFTERSIELNKAGIINTFEQKSTNLQQEAQLNWAQLTSKEFDFDRREQQIAAMQSVTAEEVNALMTEVFFQNPRRINLKVHSHAHAADIAKRQES